VVLGQRHKTFPNWDAHREVQHIPKDRITLWAGRIRPGGFLPPPSETEDTYAKQQCVEHKNVKHDSGGRVQGCRREPQSRVAAVKYPYRWLDQNIQPIIDNSLP
jgi:hypothetical protein